MAAPHAPDIDAMDWSAGTIALGTREAEEAQTALVSAAVVLGGAPPAGPSHQHQHHPQQHQSFSSFFVALARPASQSVLRVPKIVYPVLRCYY